MTQYLIRRLVAMIPMLLGVTFLSFLIMNFAPGDPTTIYLDPTKPFSQEEIDMIKKELGLDQPLMVRYIKWLGRTLKGDLGYSYVSRRPVIKEIAERLPNTILLAVTTMIISFVVGSLVGVYTALNQYKLSDYVVTVLAFLGLSTPGFWLALMLILVFAGYLKWLPSVGMMSINVGPGFFERLWDLAKHMIMPVMVSCASGIASWARYQRSSMLEVIRQDYIRTARAKGLTEKVVIGRHAVRNAAIPVITILGMSIPGLIGGSALIEQIFAWPGMGRLGINAIFSRDYPVIMAVNLMTSILVMLGNLTADVLYAVVDPRIRYR